MQTAAVTEAGISFGFKEGTVHYRAAGVASASVRVLYPASSSLRALLLPPGANTQRVDASVTLAYYEYVCVVVGFAPV